jgi:translation initiation factor 2 subunit 2
MSFVMAELGTEGSIDGNQHLIIKGRYVSKQMESLLKKYIGSSPFFSFSFLCYFFLYFCSFSRWISSSSFPCFSVEYVTCHMCRNPETTLTRDSVTRLYFVQCEACCSRRSVAPIKSGFHATSRADRQKKKDAAH